MKKKINFRMNVRRGQNFCLVFSLSDNELRANADV